MARAPAQTIPAFSGVNKAKGKPIMRVQFAAGDAVYQLRSLEDVDALLAVLNPLRTAARGAPAAGATAGAGAASVVPPADVQKAVFAAQPELQALYTRYGLLCCRFACL